MISPDGLHLRGWVTRQSVLRVLAERVDTSTGEAERGQLAAEFSDDDAASHLHVPRTPLEGYEIVEVSIWPESPALGRHIGEIPWPSGSIVVAAGKEGELVTPRGDLELGAGERVISWCPQGSPRPARNTSVTFPPMLPLPPLSDPRSTGIERIERRRRRGSVRSPST